jgi:signal transduction histidine kinase
LPTGKNTFEVKARDLDLNEDPTPAAIHFSVTPPIWQQPWFVALVFIMLSGVGFQTIRIIRRDRKLLTANIELEAARESLEQRVTERTADLETRNAELERFTYTVSHDLKSPLVTIRGFLGLLKKDALAGDRARMEGDIEQIDNAAGSMSELLDDLLELSRIGRIVNPNEEISLEALSKQVVNLLKPQAEERSIQITIAPNLPSIYGDRLRLQEVLQNLIENAIKFCRDTANPHIEIGHRSENGQELCFVKDNGIGIEPQYHEKVFGLFERLDDSKEGTDIGLALVKRIVELHGGTVWVESKGAGKGTTFCFTLPSKKIS